MNLSKNKIYGVIGLIGSGKSTFINIAKKMGHDIIDADKINVYNKKIIKEKIEREISNKVYINDTDIDRKLLSNIIFNDKNKLMLLESILYPFIEEEILLMIKNSKSKLIFIEGINIHKLKKIYFEKYIIINKKIKN